MGRTDLTTAIVVGAVVGLIFVALGHAQMVWLARQRRAPELGRRERPSPARTLLSWAAALVAALCLLRAATSRGLPDRPGLLVAEDLFTVRARPGLVGAFQSYKADVRRGEPLIRFTGQDGREAKLAIQDRRRQAALQLASERVRPLDFDAETARRADAARASIREHEDRVKQLVSERDAIAREGTSQRLGLDARRFAIEGQDRDAARELAPLQASLRTEKEAVRAAEELVTGGFISRLEFTRQRDAVGKLEGQVRQLGDRRSLLARERGELASLRSLAVAQLDRQLKDREAELAAERAQLDAARADLKGASDDLERDRPRLVAEREKRLRQLEGELADWDALLDGRGPQLVVQAPWDGRVGFREPSPGAVPADGGPLLVAYRPRHVWAAVRLEPGEPGAARRLDAALIVQGGPAERDPVDRPGSGAEPLAGTVVRRAALADGATELHVACDPPERVVRQLAMAGNVPVVARLTRPLATMPSFWAGVASASLAAGLALYGPLRRRAGQLVAPRPAAGREPGEGGQAGAPGRPQPGAWPPEPAMPPPALLVARADGLEPARGDDVRGERQRGAAEGRGVGA